MLLLLLLPLICMTATTKIKLPKTPYNLVVEIINATPTQILAAEFNGTGSSNSSPTVSVQISLVDKIPTGNSTSLANSNKIRLLQATANESTASTLSDVTYEVFAEKSASRKAVLGDLLDTFISRGDDFSEFALSKSDRAWSDDLIDHMGARGLRLDKAEINYEKAPSYDGLQSFLRRVSTISNFKLHFEQPPALFLPETFFDFPVEYFSTLDISPAETNVTDEYMYYMIAGRMNIGYAPLLTNASIRSFLERAIYSNEDRVLQARLSFLVTDVPLDDLTYVKDMRVDAGMSRWTIYCPKEENGSVPLRNFTVTYDARIPNFEQHLEVIFVGYKSTSTIRLCYLMLVLSILLPFYAQCL